MARSADALWRDACGSALARRLRKRYGVRLLSAVRRGSALMPRTRPGATPAEALWRDPRGSALTRRLRKRCGATPVEALWRDAC